MWIPIIIPFGLTDDEWAQLFFIPFFKVKKGTPFLHCSMCGCTVPYVESYNPQNQVEDLNFEPSGEDLKPKKKHHHFRKEKKEEELH
ncbi:hypothetical protein PPL_11058 [Heterostelium album PN500]|uniref:Uncharacterized protein n=1 Tax=Heterostelium pallidum (strain ATCC 26659 / Pp 5 / PN500) TaxID=670386 RepID=D3BST8_HETP5|nr:hypothetical protein PPL_11058 [Heterostelium album PN500]EFA75553.1 hypothetical protein PPL_11058 [Heterostelium album PN500]|eukprot:XP_020427687.1 hypothetical protein PPL_11058 [Heterostelium album PN500]